MGTHRSRGRCLSNRSTLGRPVHGQPRPVPYQSCMIEGSLPPGSVALSGRAGAVSARGSGGKRRARSHSVLEHTPSLAYVPKTSRRLWTQNTGAVADRSRYRGQMPATIVPESVSPATSWTASRQDARSRARGHHRGPSEKWSKSSQGSGLARQNSGRCSSPEQLGNSNGEPQPMLPEVAIGPTGEEIRGGTLP